VKTTGDSSKYIFGCTTYIDGKPTNDAIDLTTMKNRENVKILPGKIGNIVIVEYLSKEKSLHMRVQKLNY
jgi:hypothetical protein